MILQILVLKLNIFCGVLQHIYIVYAIKSQTSNLREALLQLVEQDNNPKIKSEVESLATHEIGNFEFLIAMFIWFELLTDVNEINKSLQKNTCVLMWL